MAIRKIYFVFTDPAATDLGYNNTTKAIGNLNSDFRQVSGYRKHPDKPNELVLYLGESRDRHPLDYPLPSDLKGMVGVIRPIEAWSDDGVKIWPRAQGAAA